MCNSCPYRQYCDDCKAETPLCTEKPSRSRIFIRKNERKPRVIVSGDVVYIEGQPFELNHNIEVEIKEGKRDIFALSKDKKFSFHFRKHESKIVLLKMQKFNNFEEKPNKRAKPNSKLIIIGKIDSEKYLNLAGGH
jgi:hypothetical protein